MATIRAAVAFGWSESGPGGVIRAAMTAAWSESNVSTILRSIGSDYTPSSAPPPGGTPTTPGDQTPGSVIPIGKHYAQTNTLVVTDLRDGSQIEVENVTLSLDDGSAFWTLSARGGQDLFPRFTTGETPVVRVTINGIAFEFIVETVNAERRFASNPTSFGGRSTAAVCDSPYQFKREWYASGPTSASQICSGAQAYTNVSIDWALEDWLVPAWAWSFQGTPFEAVRQVAGAVGAVVEADRSSATLRISPRYPWLPNEWESVAPDVQVAWDATESEAYARDDRPPYDGILLGGQQQGMLALVRLAGTSGSNQAPMVTDPLLTDVPALVQRGTTELASGGGKARVTRVLQVLTGGGLPGILRRGSLARFVDPAETWTGIIRGVSVEARHGYARQTVTVERQTAFVLGTQAPTPIPAPPPPPALFLAPCTSNANDTIEPLATLSFAGPSTSYSSLGATLHAPGDGSYDSLMWTAPTGKLSVAARPDTATVTFSAEIDVLSMWTDGAASYYSMFSVSGFQFFTARPTGGVYRTVFALAGEYDLLSYIDGPIKSGLYEIEFAPGGVVTYRIGGVVYRTATFPRASTSLTAIVIAAADRAGHREIRVRNVKMVVT